MARNRIGLLCFCGLSSPLRFVRPCKHQLVVHSHWPISSWPSPEWDVEHKPHESELVCLFIFAIDINLFHWISSFGCCFLLVSSSLAALLPPWKLCHCWISFMLFCVVVSCHVGFMRETSGACIHYCHVLQSQQRLAALGSFWLHLKTSTDRWMRFQRTDGDWIVWSAVLPVGGMTALPISISVMALTIITFLQFNGHLQILQLDWRHFPRLLDLLEGFGSCSTYLNHIWNMLAISGHFGNLKYRGVILKMFDHLTPSFSF